jgi:hypothetical protein
MAIDSQSPSGCYVRAWAIVDEVEMKAALLSMSAVGPERLLTNVGSPPPFALSLSKGQAELVEAFVPRAKGFDRLSPNGEEAVLRYLSPNGSLRTVNFAFGPKPHTRFMRRGWHAAQ